MSVQNSTCFAPLPRSFYFITMSRGSRTRTVAVRATLAHALAVVVPLFGLAGLGAILCLVFHDDLVAGLMARQSQMQYAYEDRIDALRGELQRQSMHQIKDQAAVETRLHDLASRAALLEGRDAVIASLAPRSNAAQAADARQVDARQAIADLASPHAEEALAPNPWRGKDLPALPPGVIGFAPMPPASPATARPPVMTKPHPEAEIDNPPAATARPDGRVSALDVDHAPLPLRLSLVTGSLDHVEQAQIGTLLRLGSAARVETARLNAILDGVGLSAERFRVPGTAAAGMGGPFVPLPKGGNDAFGATVAQVETSIAAASGLRQAVGRVPLVSPVVGAIEVTSPFGARLDPFLGRPALHTGVDLREDFGVDAKATAPGKVIFAGAMGGYGNMVEVDHGNGLTSRYAHLEQILVSTGQSVSRGDVVGAVGATGRATGPHLHYEVRIDGEPVDPMRFIGAATHLAQLDAH